MFGEWYNSSLRRYSVLMGDLFSRIKIVRMREGKTNFIKVPITFASKERFVEQLTRNAITNQDDRAKLDTVLPRMNLQMVSMVYDSKRKTNITNRSLSTVGRNIASGTITQYNPVPYTLTFELGIYTRYQDDMFQILEQIVPYFQPHFNTKLIELYGNDITFERDVPIVLKDTSPDETIEGDHLSKRRIEWLLTFELNAWLYPPVAELQGEIKSVYIDFFANNIELSSNGSFESVDSIVTPENTTEETWTGTSEQSYSHDIEIPTTPTLRENKDGTG